ncbi:MAG TPA: hypothetical protein VJ875_12965 [Pyrinomonadaceae bacterium]|nr:hypothetical protein [Pyrinomonadaceae bacterium]
MLTLAPVVENFARLAIRRLLAIDGASIVIFGLRDGVPSVAPQRPVRAPGGFVQIGFPLSRIFDTDSKDGTPGWTAYVYYGDCLQYSIGVCSNSSF